jgi:hypothetical protein
LSRLGTLLDVHDELLLALLELCALAVEFALRLYQRALMLAQTFRWRYGATEERFLRQTEFPFTEDFVWNCSTAQWFREKRTTMFMI